MPEATTITALRWRLEVSSPLKRELAYMVVLRDGVAVPVCDHIREALIARGVRVAVKTIGERR